MKNNPHAQPLAYESMFRSLVANLPGVVYRCANDKDWTMQFISDHILTLTGYPASEFIGSAVRSYASVIHPNDRQKVALAVQTGVEKNEPFLISYRIVRADGGFCHVYERGTGVCNAAGEALWLDGIIMDDTLRKQSEEDLTRSKKETERKVQDLEKLNTLMIGREVRMADLKKEVDALLGQMGLAPRYHKSSR